MKGTIRLTSQQIQSSRRYCRDGTILYSPWEDLGESEESRELRQARMRADGCTCAAPCMVKYNPHCPYHKD